MNLLGQLYPTFLVGIGFHPLSAQVLRVLSSQTLKSPHLLSSTNRSVLILK
ncbi:hypothetical protein M595_5553 [Lyngbya aestuarii BL J]|uniref:Uncharacterized protein n=1 Tax=Lyngbya aestuarii BL J TaxID=1348334 RepID=U7Q9K9_9CYAN|nr:hypothetical protein M595_5553 [Lyngbya aestuarii BL J]